VLKPQGSNSLTVQNLQSHLGQKTKLKNSFTLSSILVEFNMTYAGGLNLKLYRSHQGPQHLGQKPKLKLEPHSHGLQSWLSSTGPMLVG
jgi:hypothetical protein